MLIKLINTSQSVHTPYQKEAAWIMNSNSAQRVLSLLATNNNALAMADHGQYTLLGHPMHICNTVRDHSILFGNLKNYQIVWYQTNNDYTCIDQEHPSLMIQCTHHKAPNITISTFRRGAGFITDKKAFSILQLKEE